MVKSSMTKETNGHENRINKKTRMNTQKTKIELSLKKH